MINLKEWQLNNLVVELRYPPSPYFFKNKNAMIEKLYVDFPNNNLNNIDVIVMHTEENPGVGLNVFPNRTNIMFEGARYIGDIVNKSNNVINGVFEFLGINKVSRFGMRINLVKKVDELSADRILNKFINNQFENYMLLSSSCVLNLRTINNENLRIALNKGISQNFIINQSQIQQNSSNSGIITDIDFSKENVKSDEILTLIKNGLREYEKCQLEIQ